ncbi:MAG: hypothetical protein LH629_03205 [Ignavibacteria bacterium]|nr:hypothetical protein [Ignavibacteria bacterium]
MSIKTGVKMEAKVSDLTVSQLKDIISIAVQENVEDILEDLKLIPDSDFKKSIEEARQEYKEGKVTGIDDILNV